MESEVTQNLSYNRKSSPHRRQGLDWDAIRREREAKMTPEELEREKALSPFTEEGHLKGTVVAKLNAETKLKLNGNPGKTVDWALVKRLYVEDKMTVNQIQARTGYSLMAIRNALKSQDVYVPNRDRKGKKK